MNISNNLRRIRKEKKMTLKNLAQASNLSISFISDIEHNRKNPSLETINKLCNALDVNISNLTSNFLDLDDIEGLEKQEIDSIISNFKKLNLKGKNKVKNYIEDILNNDQYIKELSPNEIKLENQRQIKEMIRKLTENPTFIKIIQETKGDDNNGNQEK